MYEIEAKNIKKSFGNLEVLKSISLQVNKGEVVAILGSSGSGKSTFLRCLNLLEQPTGGEILFKGKNILAPKFNIVDYVKTAFMYQKKKRQKHFQKLVWYSNTLIFSLI